MGLTPRQNADFLSDWNCGHLRFQTKPLQQATTLPSTSDPRRCQIPQFNDFAMADMNISQ